MAEAPLLELTGIAKRFPGVVANDHVDFDLAPGEVHALLGENGAGKSTLMNILYGLYHPDEGEIRLRGERVRIDSPRAAIDAGIGMVHQHFMLIPVMTVAENIVLGVEPHPGRSSTSMPPTRGTRDLQRFGLAVRPEARIESISWGCSSVEILKALFRGAEILILDEPTAVLTPQEAEELFQIVPFAPVRGQVHHLHQPQARRGRHRRSHHRPPARKRSRPSCAEGATGESLARLMVGRDVLLRVEKKPADPGQPLLRVEDLRVLEDRGLECVRGISFEVRAGEIVGIAGVDGNGQTGSSKR